MGLPSEEVRRRSVCVLGNLTEEDAAKLLEFMDHKPGCEHTEWGGDCTCGLIEATDGAGLTEPH